MNDTFLYLMELEYGIQERMSAVKDIQFQGNRYQRITGKR